MIALMGDVHHDVAMLRDLLERIPPQVRSIVQEGDMWVWPHPDNVPTHADGSPLQLPPYPRHRGLHWRRPPRDMTMVDVNHHNFSGKFGLSRPTPIAAGLLFIPRGTVTVLEGRSGPLRVGFLGGTDSIFDADQRIEHFDWWPELKRVSPRNVDRLLESAKAHGGEALLVTHMPPATVTTIMTGGGAPHPSAVLVEEAWRALGGGVPDAPIEIVSGHMHRPYRDDVLCVEVLDYLGVTLR